MTAYDPDNIFAKILRGDLPAYKVPSTKAVLALVWERCRVFVVQTGSVILALSLVLWALLTFPNQAAETDTPERAQAYRLEHSFGGQLGHAIEPVIISEEGLATAMGHDWEIR